MKLYKNMCHNTSNYETNLKKYTAKLVLLAEYKGVVWGVRLTRNSKVDLPIHEIIQPAHEIFLKTLPPYKIHRGLICYLLQ